MGALKGQQKACNFDPQSFVVISCLGVLPWCAGEQMGGELTACSQEPQVWDTGILPPEASWSERPS